MKRNVAYFIVPNDLSHGITVVIAVDGKDWQRANFHRFHDAEDWAKKKCRSLRRHLGKKPITP